MAVGKILDIIVDMTMTTLTLDFAQHSDILVGHKVNSDTLTAEPTATANAVDVVLAVRGQVVVDDERNLLHVNTTRKQIRRDENTGGAGTELLHQQLALLLVHVAVLNT